MDDDRDDVYRDFKESVNMAPSELEDWLDTSASRSVGVTDDGGRKSQPSGAESVGHESGRRILAIKSKRKAELDDDDYDHMRKVIGYVNRHSAQKPAKEPLETSRWRYSLMNWGHDPLKQ